MAERFDSTHRAALEYLLSIYTAEHLAALRRGDAYVEVAVGNFPRFLTALQDALTRIDSADRVKVDDYGHVG